MLRASHRQQKKEKASLDHCLRAMKIVHHHANGRFDWLISGHQSVNPSREVISILPGKYKRFTFVHPVLVYNCKSEVSNVCIVVEVHCFRSWKSCNTMPTTVLSDYILGISALIVRGKQILYCLEIQRIYVCLSCGLAFLSLCVSQ